MIRFRDGLTLARTKLKTHKIRTGISLAVGSILFGLLVAVMIISQGVVDSVDRFSKEGLNNRTVLNIYTSRNGNFEILNNLENSDFVNEVEAAHKAYVAKKTALAKKYSIEYDATKEDPSPIVVNPSTKRKSISVDNLSSPAAEQVLTEKSKATLQTFDINNFISEYKGSVQLKEYYNVLPTNGQLTFMTDGSENFDKIVSLYLRISSADMENSDKGISVLDSSLADPFISYQKFDYSKGEIPAIFSYALAEKALNIKSLPNTASSQEKLDRIALLRSRINEASTSFCYRNQASLDLVSAAVNQAKEIKSNLKNPEYTKPSVIYQLPDKDSCGAVTIAKDNRTAAEKKQDENQKLFEKELGTYIGDPVEKKITLRGVGIFSENQSVDWSVSGIISGLLSPRLGGSGYIIPSQMLSKVSDLNRPSDIFANSNGIISKNIFTSYNFLIEFDNKDQAKRVMDKYGATSYSGSDNIIASTFGSNSILFEDFSKVINQWLMIALLVVGIVAVIIISGVIGRVVSDGRRESAIFRAIGAKRRDIAAIYGIYTLLLALRAAILSLIMGFSLALVVEILYSQDATASARVAYAASTNNLEFHFIDIPWSGLLAVLGMIILTSALAAVGPIIRNVRRNPINDMRED